MERIALPVDRAQLDERRFWKHLSPGAPGECWEWQGYRFPHGYGRFGTHGRGYILAHRASYALNNGPIPAGLAVCHRCDNPPCCNPAHLFLGSQGDNMRDCIAKGRHHTVATRKVPQSALAELVARYASGAATLGQLAKEYGLSKSYASLLVRRSGIEPYSRLRSLTAEQVSFIREAYANREPGTRMPNGAQVAIAQHLGIPKHLIGAVARGAAYRNVAVNKEAR